MSLNLMATTAPDNKMSSQVKQEHFLSAEEKIVFIIKKPPARRVPMAGELPNSIDQQGENIQ